MNEELWYIVELKGRRQRAGQIAETEYCGGKWITISMPLPDGDWHTETYHPSVIYSLTVVSEDEARAAARDIWLEWQDEL